MFVPLTLYLLSKISKFFKNKRVFLAIHAFGIANVIISRFLGPVRYPIALPAIFASPVIENLVLSFVEFIGVLYVYKEVVKEKLTPKVLIWCALAVWAWGFAAQRIIIEVVYGNIGFLIGRWGEVVVYFFTVAIIGLGKTIIDIVADKESAIRELAIRKQDELSRIKEDLKKSEEQIMYWKNYGDQIAEHADKHSKEERMEWQRAIDDQARKHAEDVKRLTAEIERRERELHESEKKRAESERVMTILEHRYRHAFPNAKIEKRAIERMVEMQPDVLGSAEHEIQVLLNQYHCIPPAQTNITRVESAEKVNEIYFYNRKWRIYFKKEDGGPGGVRILIGNKSDQKSDVEWLRRNW
jgi:hypothetical protein